MDVIAFAVVVMSGLLVLFMLYTFGRMVWADIRDERQAKPANQTIREILDKHRA